MNTQGFPFQSRPSLPIKNMREPLIETRVLGIKRNGITTAELLMSTGSSQEYAPHQEKWKEAGCGC